ncbi:MAG TPA: cell envelope integrity protein CreD [Steroidobacteraceae bacterium]|jgi:inner membrane protein|nr:cell envelope integrity protein CreD [Steroidobacteraceae bacterium]
MPGLNSVNPLLAKLLLVVLLTLMLLLPLSRVEGLIAERAQLRDSAVARVANGVGHAQSIGAVMMVVPVTRTWVDNGKEYSETKNHRVLAGSVDVTGTVDSASRRSGIYTVPTFKATLHIVGSISDELLMEARAPEPGVSKKTGNMSLFMAVSDPTGIRALTGIRVDGILVPVNAATEAGLQGVSAQLISVAADVPRRREFAVDLVVSGTERLQFLPFAQSTHVKLESPWPSPSFSGAFSPDAPPQVGPHGFSADWQVLQINRSYPQSWADGAVSEADLAKSAFGVDFYLPVDAYQRDYRAIHYAVLFIALTFMGLFLWEHTLGTRVHPMQYAMTGAALSVFYLVLTALSEHLDFAGSYTLAAGAMTLLLSAYFSGVLQSRSAGAITGVLAGVCYSLLYLLVLSEDYALLFGALAIFFLLAITLIGTRKLDWYRVAESHKLRS